MNQGIENKVSDSEIDAILDAALDDLDSDGEANNQGEESQSSKPKSKEATPESAVARPPATATVEEDDERDAENESLNEVMNDILRGREGEAAFSAILEHIQSQVASEFPNQSSSARRSQQGQRSGQTNNKEEGSSSTGDVDRTISRLLDDMAAASSSMDDMPKDEQTMMDDLMREFEKMNDNLNPDDIMDGMMEQLLSKELMYEPMKQVADKFPEYLESKKDSLPKSEYEQRCKQYECFKKLLHVYETDPDNTEKLVGLMQQVQEYGQPPPEIVKDIAPGLDVDGEGVPNIEGLLAGIGGGEGEECRLM